MKDLTGTTLKKQYFLRELAGRGGMADVYRAWDNRRASQMAVKVLRHDRSEFEAAFEKEALRLEELSHPHIVRLYEFVREKNIAFIVMDWVDGGSLRQHIDALGRPCSLPEVMRILEPVCSALNFAHHASKPIFHCDIKPSNIMLHQNGTGVFLADFGVARLASEGGNSGTPPYMAPEQFAHQVSAQSDIYALGITVYEMLTGGRLPFHGDSSSPGSTTRAKYEWEHRNRELPPLGQFNPSLPPAVIEAVNKALYKDARRRYASALAFWKAFHNASGPGKDARGSSGNGDMTIFTPGPPPEGTPPGPRQPAPRPAHIPHSPPAAVRLGAPHLYARSGEMAGRSFAIPKQGLKIGRHRECQIHLQDRSISREHATVFITKQGGFVRDDKSMVGTFLNDRRLPAAAPVPLSDGDVIRVGLYQHFQFFLK